MVYDESVCLSLGLRLGLYNHLSFRRRGSRRRRNNTNINSYYPAELFDCFLYLLQLELLWYFVRYHLDLLCFGSELSLIFERKHEILQAGMDVVASVRRRPLDSFQQHNRLLLIFHPALYANTLAAELHYPLLGIHKLPPALLQQHVR